MSHIILMKKQKERKISLKQISYSNISFSHLLLGIVSQSLKGLDIIDRNHVRGGLLLRTSGTATAQRILRLNFHDIRIRVFFIFDIIVILHLLYIVTLVV